MKKIVFVTESLIGMGGVVKVITQWSNYFAPKGYDIENVSVYKGKPYFDLDSRVKFTIANFKFRYKLLKLIDIIPNAIRMYYFLNKRRGANIVFNKSLYIEPIWILRKLGLFKDVNLIYFSHGGSSCFREFYLNSRFTSHRIKMMFSSFDKVISLFDDEKKYPKHIDKSKLYFISNTLPFERSSVGFEKKENIVLSLGRVTKAKGIDTLIYAWDIIKDKIEDWSLHIVGEGDDKKEFMELAKKLNIDNIKFIEGISEVKPFYEKSKIFVIPSVLEGFGLTIIEAMACKNCVISSKTAGGNYLVKDNGLLFDIGNSKQLAELILQVIKDKQKREKLANKSYDFSSEFEIENIANKWNEILI